MGPSAPRVTAATSQARPARVVSAALGVPSTRLVAQLLAESTLTSNICAAAGAMQLRIPGTDTRYLKPSDYYLQVWLDGHTTDTPIKLPILLGVL